MFIYWETRNYLVLEPLNWLHMLFGACRSFCTREMASNFFFCLKTGFKLFKRKKRVFFPQDSSMHKLVISLLSETNNLGKCIVLQRGLYVNQDSYLFWVFRELEKASKLGWNSLWAISYATVSSTIFFFLL